MRAGIVILQGPHVKTEVPGDGVTVATVEIPFQAAALVSRDVRGVSQPADARHPVAGVEATGVAVVEAALQRRIRVAL